MEQEQSYNRITRGATVEVRNIRLPFEDKAQAQRTWTIQCTSGIVSTIEPFQEETQTSAGDIQNAPPDQQVIDGRAGLLLPSFCHSHIHLDKCFLLDKCGDLTTGDFSEAMQVTNAAKGQFPAQTSDLYARGSRIIRESVELGVTSIRAHVEVDSAVGFSCLDVAQRLQEDCRAICDVQLSIFAQEPLLSSDDQLPSKNLLLLREAAARQGFDVIGSAPYVEATPQKAKANIALIFNLADEHDYKNVDFHLDYNLDAESEPLIYEVIRQAKARYFVSDSDASTASQAGPQASESSAITTPSPKRQCPNITIGHATRLQMMSPDEWRALTGQIKDLPITFVGLPQSDIYMQGRALKGDPLGAPRGTLRVPDLAREYGIHIAMSVNNVENAFTPQGSLDPLSLCTFGVAIFQAATPRDVRELVRSVTRSSKSAIGIAGEAAKELVPSIGDPADFVILHGRDSLQSAVFNPPVERTTIKAGKMVATRRLASWAAVGVNNGD